MNRIILSTLGLAAIAPFIAQSADQENDADLNRFSLGARFGLNLKANFHNHAPVLSPNPGPGLDGRNHRYNDGYVLLDSSGDAGGLTWNWGYENASQVVGDTIRFHAAPTQSFSSSGNDEGVKDDPQAGAELVYQRVLGHLPIFSCARWGLEAGFGYADFDLRGNTSGTLVNTVNVDAYPLGGVLPPGAGYHGTFDGPGALLGDTATRLSSSVITSVGGQQKLSGQLFTVRLGPFVEWNFTRKLSVALSGGVTVAPTVMDYDFPQTYSFSAGITTSGSVSKTGVLWGPFVGATLRYDLTKHWGAYVGAQFQSLNDMEISSGPHSAKLDPGAMVYGTAGVTFRF